MRVAPLITAVAQQVQQQLDALYAAGDPTPGSALDQAGLRDGAEIVVDYLSHGEAGVAFDHLLYMISEPDLVLSAGTYAELARAGEMLELPEDALASISRAAGG